MLLYMCKHLCFTDFMQRTARQTETRQRHHKIAQSRTQQRERQSCDITFACTSDPARAPATLMKPCQMKP